MSLALVLTATFRRLLDLFLLALILVVLAALLVARAVPAVTGLPAYVVGGGSMEPTIHLGSVVIPERVAAQDLRVGDVVSLQVGPQHTVFTHRVIRLIDHGNAPWIQTKGDANRVEDPSIIPASDVIGRVNVVVPYLGYAVQLLSIPQGVALLLSVGIALLVSAWLLESLEDEQRAWVQRRRLAFADLTPLDAAQTGLPG